MLLEAYYNTSAFMRWAGFPWSDEHMGIWLRALLFRAKHGPCSKSKRAALVLDTGSCSIEVNGPPGGRVCTNNDACRAACSQICVHAEERVLATWLRGWVSFTPPKGAHVIHVAVDADGQPRPKGTPSCASRFTTRGVQP